MPSYKFFIPHLLLLFLSGFSSVAQTQNLESGQTPPNFIKYEQQLGKAKTYLFKEYTDSTRIIIEPLLKELSDNNLLDTPQGLEAQLLEISILELNNTRGEALEKILPLIEACKVQKEWMTLSRVYLVAELAYEFLDKPERCLFYFNKCKALIEAYNLETTYPFFYVRYSTYHRIWGDRDSSYYYAAEALRTSKFLYESTRHKLNRQRYEDITSEYATAHNILGSLYKTDGNIKKAKYHLAEAKTLWQKTGANFNTSWAYIHLTRLYSSQKNYDLALANSDSSLVYGKLVFDDWGILGEGLQSSILLERAKIYQAVEKSDSAYHFLDQGYLSKIKVINARNHLHATEVEARHTDQQKASKIEQQNEQLDKEQKWRFQLMGILTALLLLAIGLVYSFIRLRKSNKKNKEQAKELKALDKVKSNFFANISHELRTPLTLILGPLSYILDNPEAWKKESVQKQLLVMQRNGKSLMELIEEILDLSKLEANKLELLEEGTPVVQFFEYLFQVFKPQFESQTLDYELIMNINEDLNILMDRKKMEKVLNNFLSNAIKFTPRKGKITLEVNETGLELQIIVSDTGQGIHPKDLPFIFDRFYQSKQADQTLFGGTGIGLALVNEFAQLMGGKVYAESNLGAGSKFFFEMPKKVVTKKEILLPTTINLPEDEIFSIGRDFTILVVEDNHDMRDFIYQLLQKKYSQVLLANNGAEGLETLKKHGTKINLIVSDVMMPIVDGLTMLKAIKNNKEWYNIPVIMLTALAAERDKLTALTIGVDDYLTKPFSVSELLLRVQNLLFNYHQRMEWQASAKFQEQKDGKLDSSLKSKKWVNELTELIEKSFSNGIIDVEELAASAFISSRQMNRKLNAITGLSAGKFIREIQLQAARKELENGTAISISEVAYKVGFENQSTFSRVFKNRFGKTPSNYLKKRSD